MRRIGCLLLGLLLGLPGSGDDEVDVEELRSRLEELERSLADERRGLDDDRAAQKSELEELRGRRDAQAVELLDQQIAVVELQSRRDRLRQESSQTRREAQKVGALATALQEGARNLAERLKIHLAEVPGTGATRDELSTLAAAGAARAWDAAVRERPLRALQQLDRALEQASRVSRERSEVWTAAGRRESVELLSVGHVAWAYDAGGDRRGLALASPADASGYRWTEELPETAAKALAEAFAGDSGSIAFPLDVSGRIQVDSGLDEGGLWQSLKDGGPIMIPLALIALLALVLIAERLHFLYVRDRPDERRVQQILGACRAGRYDEARQLAEAGRGAVVRTMARCIENREASTTVQEDSVQEHLLHEIPRLDRFLGGLSSLAAVAPLLGLLGTVTGIINTFGVIKSYGNANASLMAGGISEALVTTATGMSVAIPILLIQVVLRGRADQTLADAERHAATLLNLFAAEEEA